MNSSRGGGWCRAGFGYGRSVGQAPEVHVRVCCRRAICRSPPPPPPGPRRAGAARPLRMRPAMPSGYSGRGCASPVFVHGPRFVCVFSFADCTRIRRPFQIPKADPKSTGPLDMKIREGFRICQRNKIRPTSIFRHHQTARTAHKKLILRIYLCGKCSLA